MTNLEETEGPPCLGMALGASAVMAEVDRRPRCVSFDGPPMPFLSLEPLDLASDDAEGGEPGTSDGRQPFGYSGLQGTRKANEDRLILGAPLGDEWHCWGVLDGHGGRRVAEHLVDSVPQALQEVWAAHGA